MIQGKSRRPALGASAFAGALLICGCAVDLDLPTTDKRNSAIVYGADDRVEYFEVASPEARARMSQSVVALVPNASLHRNATGVEVQAPTWGEVDGLCPGEPFADQPAAAFCTGVLVDWDLVLTAGHCVRLFALEDFAVVFDYDYMAPGKLALGSDILNPIAIVAEALDPPDSEPRLDYAWLRLDRFATAPRQPSPVYVGRSPVALGDPVISIGAGGGVPLKLDSGGTVRDVRAQSSDYFIADTDTSGGSSGGGAFDQRLVLTGILTRGQTDLAQTDAGCNTTAHELDGSAAAEQFTYAHRAVERLCAADASASSLCRPDCGEPCEALPPPMTDSEGGCAIGGGGSGPSSPLGFALVLSAHTAGCLVCCRRRRRRPRGRRSPWSNVSAGASCPAFPLY